MDRKEQAIQMAKSLNNKLEASIMNVPVLEGFNIMRNATSDNIIFAAISENHYIEQLIADAYLKENETLDSKIEESIKTTEEYMAKAKLSQSDKNFIFLKEYSGTFKFKVYIQDYVINNPKPSAIRQINAYFVEPQYNKFYQLSLSTGPIALPSEVYKAGIIDLESDLITKELVEMMDIIISNIKYVQ